MPASSAFDRATTASFTITLWMSRGGSLSHNMLFSVSFASASAQYGLEAITNTEMNYWDGLAHIAQGPASYGLAQWHHLAVVVSGGQATSYFDGAAVATGPADTTARTCTGVLIGTSNYGDHFPGSLDSVRFYNRALSAAEVVTDMNQ